MALLSGTTVVRDSSEPARAAGSVVAAAVGCVESPGFVASSVQMTLVVPAVAPGLCPRTCLSWAGGWSGVAGMAPAVWWDQQVHVERRADLWVLFLALCVLLPLAVSPHPP